MTFLYNCKSGLGAYRITKFDSDLNPESSYLCTVSTCECPAGHRPKCRHREMLPKFIQRGYVDTNFFFDYDRGGWAQMEQVTEQEVYGEGSNEPVDVVLTLEPEPSPELTIAYEITLPAGASPEQVAEAFGGLLGGFPDHCLSSGECTTPDDCILNGCAHGHGNPPRELTPAGLGQANESEPYDAFDYNNRRELNQASDPQPSPSPTIRKRV